MNVLNELEIMGIAPKGLTRKKQQTTYKIRYVRRYVQQWTLIQANRTEIKRLNFIDCMCNAGIYHDGDCCTAAEVLLLFNEISKDFPEKSFYVYLNDFDLNKIETFKKLVASPQFSPTGNVHIVWENKDVNLYLDMIAKNVLFKRALFSYGCTTLLYVDPYDFGTVEIPKLSEILNTNYCELLFNFFISDYKRNIKNDTGRIKHCIGEKTISTKEELLLYMENELRVGKVQYLFSYQFRTQTNVELYQIVFATPSIHGLTALKDALWDVFDGAEFHRNHTETGDVEQLTLFTPSEERDWKIRAYSKEAQQALLESVLKSHLFRHFSQIKMEAIKIKAR